MKKDNNNSISISDKVAKFIKTSGIGIGAILVGLSLFIYVSQPAVASNESSFNFEDDASLEQLRNLPVTSGGRYQMNISTLWGDGRANWYILVWDSETGRSKIYYGNKEDGTGAAHSAYDIPSSPL